MKWLDRTFASVSPLVPPVGLELGLALALGLGLGGCSDDGLAPPADTDAPSTSTAGPTSGPGEGETTGADPNPGTDTSPATSGPGGSSGDDGTTGTADEGDGSSETGAPPPSTCEAPEECVLVNDCCECSAAHVDELPPECAIDCKVPVCDALGIPDIGLVCADGTCELEPRNCAPGLVVCDSVPPRCPADTLPEVTEDGTCWTGACIPVAACDGVPSCDFCEDDEVCVQTATQLGSTYACQAIPEACGGVATCACLPPETCEEPYDTCDDGDGSIVCACLDC